MPSEIKCRLSKSEVGLQMFLPDGKTQSERVGFQLMVSKGDCLVNSLDPDSYLDLHQIAHTHKSANILFYQDH